MEVKLTSDQLSELFKLGIDINQDPRELQFIIDNIGTMEFNKVVEIGFHYGGSCKVWEQMILSDNPRHSFIVTIDLNGDRIDWNINQSPIPIHFIVGNSKDENIKEQALSIIEGNEIDFLYIDGEHSYDGVINDFYTFSPYVRKDGIIAMNDIYPPEVEVHKAWNELKQLKEYDCIGECITWTGTGILKKR